MHEIMTVHSWYDDASNDSKHAHNKDTASMHEIMTVRSWYDDASIDSKHAHNKELHTTSIYHFGKEYLRHYH